MEILIEPILKTVLEISEKCDQNHSLLWPAGNVNIRTAIK